MFVCSFGPSEAPRQKERTYKGALVLLRPHASQAGIGPDTLAPLLAESETPTLGVEAIPDEKLARQLTHQMFHLQAQQRDTHRGRG